LGLAVNAPAHTVGALAVNRPQMQIFGRPRGRELPHYGAGKFAKIDHSTGLIMSQQSNQSAVLSISQIFKKR
jgi:hypothetical protein